MSGSKPNVNIRLGTEGAEKVRRDLEAIGAEGERAGKRVQAAGTTASPALQSLAGASDTTARAFGGLSRGALGVSAGFAAMGAAAVASVTAIAKSGDQMTATMARLTSATGGIGAAQAAYEGLFRLSQQTGVAVVESAGAFTRFSVAAKEVGATNDQVLRLVAGLQKAAIVSGATGQEAGSAMMQLAQALASGTLQGDELRSVLENMPQLAQALAREFGVGVGELRKMGAEGKLTADTVLPRLLKAAENISGEFDKMPVTMERASSILGAAMTDFGARLDRVTGASRLFAEYMLKGAAAIGAAGAVIAPTPAEAADQRVARAQAGVAALASRRAPDYDERIARYRRPGMTEAEARRRAMTVEGTAGLLGFDPAEMERANRELASALQEQTEIRAAAADEQNKSSEEAAAKAAQQFHEQNKKRLEELEKSLKTEQSIRDKYRKQREEIATLEARGANPQRVAQLRAASIKAEADELESLRKKVEGVAAAHKSVAKEAKDADEHVQAFYKEQEKAAKEAAKAAEKAADDLKRYQTRSYDELVNIGERAFDRLGDALVDAFTQGNGAAVNFGNVARAIAASVVTDFAKLALINPLLNSVFTGSGGARPTLDAALGGGSGFGDLLGLSSLIPKDGIMSALGISTSGIGASIFGTPGAASFAGGPLAGVIANPGTPGLLGMGGTSFLGGSLGGLTGALGGIGGGFAAGTMLNQLLGRSENQQTNGMIGSGLGAAAGFLIGGPLGGLLGGLAGGGLGGLFGPGESVRGYGYRLEAADDGLLRMGQSFYNPEGEQAFTQATAGIDAFNAWASANGIRVGGASSVGGNRNGADLSNATAGTFADGLAQLYFHAVDEELEAALSSRGNQFASVEAMQQFVQGFGAAQQIIEALTAEPIPAFTAQLQAVNDNFNAAAAQAREYGLATDSLTAAQNRAVAELESQRAETMRATEAALQARLLAAGGDAAGAAMIRQAEAARTELNSFTDALDALALTAEERGSALSLLARTQAAEAAAITGQANAGVGLLRNLAYGSGSALAPEQQYFAALSDLNAARRSLDAGGSLADYVAVAQSALPAAQQYLGISTRRAALDAEVAQVIASRGGDPSNLAQIVSAQVDGTNALASVFASYGDRQVEIGNATLGEIRRLSSAIEALIARRTAA
jgi:tape measure domain-containing protein